MKRVARFLREYKLFSFGLIAGLIGLALELQGWHTAAHWVLGTTAIIETFPLLWGMVEDLRTGTYGIDILAATAIVTAVILGQYWAALVVVLMLTGGESLEDFAEHRANSELDALLKHAPQKAHIYQGRKLVDVAVSSIKPGDKILVKPGEVVPVDAVIIEGESSFDESSLTGESLPQARGIGGGIVSGTVNLEGAITAKASASAADSQYQQIIRLVQGAGASQAPFVRLADRYSIPFTFAAYAIAGTVWVLTGSAIRFLEVIIVATPCPLLLAAPIALISGMARASKYGIIVRTGSALEKLAEAKTIAFDKTGTLTRGELELDTIKAYGKHTEDHLLALAASAEQNSSHILAQAVTRAASAKQLKFIKAKNVQEVSGRGLIATVKGQRVLIGRLSLLEEHNIILPAGTTKKAVNQTALYIAIDGHLAGTMTFKDELRPESAATLKRLNELGFSHTLMVTGDNQTTANSVAKQLGIGEVHAEMLPADKLYVIEKETLRPLVFVGDGVNDAPVLTAADVGIALGARGSTAASESADLVILPDSVGHVAIAASIARRTFKIATQSIVVGIALSIILMSVFATGKFSPLLGAVLQEVVDVVVIFNAMRAHSNKLVG
ncbi:MAG: heavy metal translocating P-type ATPase [Candidatus Saccharibacteria bacterium]|nr:heavy metal translocating P-type ATPase [Candidatus Saccharibacteria bacterium]